MDAIASSKIDTDPVILIAFFFIWKKKNANTIKTKNATYLDVTLGFTSPCHP